MKFIFSILAMAAVLSLSAEQIVKVTGKKDVLKVQQLTINPDGSLSYVLDGKKQTLPSNTYDYVRISKPREIMEADKVLSNKDFVKAEKLFQIAFGKYHRLGWGVYCIAKRAEALDGANRLKDAIAFLEQLKNYTSFDPEVNGDIRKARMLYVDLLIKAGNLKQAGLIAEAMLSEKDDESVFFALERKGDIALLKKEKKTAVRNYVQAVFLFLEHPDRPAVLYKVTVLLKEMKDSRWEKFAELLKKQYSESPYAKKL